MDQSLARAEMEIETEGSSTLKQPGLKTTCIGTDLQWQGKRPRGKTKPERETEKEKQKNASMSD